MLGNLISFLDIETIIFDFLIPAFAFILAFVIQAYYKNRRRKLYSDVFGTEALQHKNILISVPLRILKESSRNDTRFVRRELDGNDYYYYGPSEVLSFEDLQSCNTVLKILEEFFSTPFNFKMDNDPNLNLQRKTIFIVGGPDINSRARPLLSRKEKLFYQFLNEPNERGILDLRDNKFYKCTNEWEYSAVIRIPNGKGSFSFFISGLSMTGTSASAKYLRNNWESFAQRPDSTSVLLKMPLGDSSNYFEINENKIFKDEK